ncbi:TIGR03009 domain-containing protein [Tautonia rosea]|uniref:TIGR03009 domain-containing protein n=1 Tax=Tautonia rosea TaxID=2728037 RepID=UPI001472A7A3|nr:TIGR03009 domain-containing protein [Tautonia rosea]
MRRIAPLIVGLLAAVGPMAEAKGQATPSTPGQAPRPQAGAGVGAGARTTPPAPAIPGPSRDATYDPSVQRASAPASAPAQDSAPDQAPSDPELDAVLGRWEQTSGKIETLYATFEQVDEMTIVGDRKVYKGAAYLRRPNLVVLQLEKQTGDEGDEKFVFDRRILANGGEVVEFDGALRQITIFPLPKDAQQRALEEGPLPFLFRMNIEDFKRRYRANLMPPNQEGTHRIAIYPKIAADRDAFSVAVLILDAKTLQPKSIHTLAPNGKDKQNYYIKELKANVAIKPELFVWDSAKAQQAQKDGWRIVRNPDQPGVQPPPSEIGRQDALEPIPR